jgi:hypothetical protein
MVDRMIEFATQNVAAAKLMLGDSVEETVQKFTQSQKISRAKYDSIISHSAETAELMHMALSALKPSKS